MAQQSSGEFASANPAKGEEDARVQERGIRAKIFGTHGYVECENGDFIEATEKISIYTKDGTRGGKPTHAVKQLDEQNWASKLGDAYDICHKERAVGGGIYGEIAAYMRRTKI
jgi:hypothetical protein